MAGSDGAPELVLASGSPRRLELIRRIVPAFRSLVSPVEETGSERRPPVAFEPLRLAPPFPVPPSDDPRLWAWRKAVDVLDTNRKSIEPGTPVLAADTVVVGPGRLLNKPRDRHEAVEMLRLLRGGPHYVVTGFVVVRAEVALGELMHHEAAISTVFMRDYSEAEIDAYVSTPEPYDKAGAYALQGAGGKLVESVAGCPNNVIGLPVCAVRKALTGAGVTVLPYPFGGYCEACALVG